MTGIRAEGFVFGMVAVAAHLTSFEGNAAVDNEEYGIAAFESNSTTMADNVVSGSGEAGLYVGDSAHANLTMTGNETFGNRYGIFLRDSQNGDVVGNLIHDNCVGIMNIDLPRLGRRRPLPHRRERHPRQQRLLPARRSPATRRCRVSASSS